MSDISARGERWRLVRGRQDVQVWPFRSEDEAADFALDHGLLDWRASRVDDPEREHEPVCARCHERWPCEHVRLDGEAKRIIHAAANRCHRCGKQVGWYKITVPGGGDLGQDVVYHGRKGACRNLAMRELERLGHHDLIARVLRDEDRRARWREQIQEMKARA